MIRVRVDDYPTAKDEERWRHTPDAFREFHRALRESIGGRRYLLGVIPKKCNPSDLVLIRDETDCVIGMHGTDHSAERLDRNGGNQFEPYLTADNLAAELAECHSALVAAVGRPVRIYMPPRNIIDRRTVILAAELGMIWYTSGPETGKQFRIYTHCIHSEPPHEYGRTDEMMQRGSHLQLIRMAEEGRDVVLTLHWPWECNIGFEHMRAFLSQIPDKFFVDFDG